MGAEIALDIAVSALTGGVISFVAKRVSITATRITIRAAHASARAAARIDGPGGMVFDGDIPPNINKMVDEEKLGGGTRLDDTAQRTQTKTTTPNTTVVKGHGRNVAKIEVDAATGRPMSVEATIMDDAGANPRGDNATAIGKLWQKGDHGGHLIAHRFMGDVPDVGIVPQAGNLNTGAWKTMENEWADWVKSGRTVDVKIEVIPPGAVRPDKFKVVYSVTDPVTGKKVYKNMEIFENDDQQKFSRVYFRDM